MASEILHEKTDVVIVGAGAGGGVVAKQLAVRGIKCVGLERGDWPIYDENANDELINQRTHAIKPLHGPDRRKFPRIAYSNEKNGQIARSLEPRIAVNRRVRRLGHGYIRRDGLAIYAAGFQAENTLRRQG